jgi:hypothetical protein
MGVTPVRPKHVKSRVRLRTAPHPATEAAQRRALSPPRQGARTARTPAASGSGHTKRRQEHQAPARAAAARGERVFASGIASHALAIGRPASGPLQIEWIQHPLPKRGRGKAGAKPPARRSPRRGAQSSARSQTHAPPGSPFGTAPAPGPFGLGQLFSGQGLQDSLKTVGNLHGMLRKGLNYLQQADQLLETFVVTGNSLKETGLLDKLVKHRGKNLTTDDFTNLLIALMNSPVGHRFFRSLQGSQDTAGTGTAGAAAADGNAGGPALPSAGSTG